jgi:hypothetical protein|tara:strand:+ start:479 stop:742 length:264 start_codon:yes stop_codon:yes gene_type:complete
MPTITPRVIRNVLPRFNRNPLRACPKFLKIRIDGLVKAGGLNLYIAPHPNLLSPREKELFAPSPSRGEGWGEGVLIMLFYRIYGLVV